MISKRITSVSIPTAAFLLAQLGIIYKTFTGIADHFSSGSLFRYDLLSFLMPAVVAAFVAIVIKANFRVNKQLFLFIIYGIYMITVTVCSMNYRGASIVFTIINMVYWIAILVIAYVYVQKKSGILDHNVWEKRRNSFFTYNAWMLFIGLVLLIQSYQNTSLMAFYANRDVLMNSVYYLIFLLPAVLCCRKKWIHYAAFFAVLIGTVFSGKRTALVIVLVCWAVWISFTMRGKSFRLKMGIIAVVIVLSVVGYNVFLSIANQYGLNLIARMNAAISGADNGSGRIDIWRETFETIADENILLALIGRGYRAVSVNSQYASLSESHNEFIQVLFDYGVFGLMLLLSICFELVRTGFRMRRENYEYAAAYWVSLIVFFLSSMVSMTLIYPYWFISMASFWGFILADFRQYCQASEAERRRKKPCSMQTGRISDMA